MTNTSSNILIRELAHIPLRDILPPMTIQVLTVIVACLSMAVSVLTLWLTLLRRGRLKMTRPTIVFFGPDGEGGEPKVYIRALLYSTGKRGLLIENMFIRVRRGESLQTFNVWVHGDDRLARGSGLYVGLEGVALDHHFLHPRDGTRFDFLPGQYTVEVFANLVGVNSPILLATIPLPLSDAGSQAILGKRVGVFYDWGPDSQSYHSHVGDRRLPVKSGTPLSLLMEAMKLDGGNDNNLK